MSNGEQKGLSEGEAMQRAVQETAEGTARGTNPKVNIIRDGLEQRYGKEGARKEMQKSSFYHNGEGKHDPQSES